MASQPLVWFITGASSGFGAALAIHSLKAGHKVIGIARDPIKASMSYPEVSSLGGHWIALDVSSPSAGDVIKDAMKVFSGIDVLVNNAGYSLLGAVEDISEEEGHLQIETNFFGPLRLIQAALPFLRAQKSGTIVNVSSVAGFDGLPACGIYATSKFALEGLSESLSRELVLFNIRILIVQPGTFRTNFPTGSTRTKRGMSEPYQGSPVEETLKYMDNLNGTQKGDPEKAAARIFEVVTGTGPLVAGMEVKLGEGETGLLRLPLGKDCLDRFEVKMTKLKENFDAVREVGLSTDLNGH